MSVLIFVENWEGKFKKLSFELVSYGSKLAEMLKTDVIVLSIGAVENDELESLAVKQGIYTQEACTLVLLSTHQY